MANTSVFMEKMYYSKSINNLVSQTKISLNSSEYNVFINIIF